MKTPWRQWLRGDWVALLPASFRTDKMPFVFLCMMMLVVVSLTLVAKIAGDLLRAGG